MAGLAGCGGSDKKATTSAVASVPTTPTAPTQTAPPVTPTATTPAPTTPTATATTPAKPPPTTTTPGGSEPARTELELRGTRAGVQPLRAGVAPYVSVRITLTSEDGSAHTLTIGGRTAKVGGSRTSAVLTLPGLRPGKSYKGTADGKAVTIRSSSEPGP